MIHVDKLEYTIAEDRSFFVYQLVKLVDVNGSGQVLVELSELLPKRSDIFQLDVRHLHCPQSARIGIRDGLEIAHLGVFIRAFLSPNPRKRSTMQPATGLVRQPKAGWA
jgi:hypothetical protein